MKSLLHNLLAALALASLLSGCAGVGPFTNNGTPYPEIYIDGSE